MEIDPFKEMGISTKALVIINEFEGQTNSPVHLCLLLSLMAKDEGEKRVIIETVDKNLRENCPCHPEDVSAIVSQLVRVALPTPAGQRNVSKKSTVVAPAVKGLVKSQFSMGFEAGLKASSSLASKRLASPDARPRTPLPSPAVEKKMTVLLADDDEHMRLILKIPLIKKGYRVIEAADGIEAWSRIKEGRIDLAILDMKMPYRHGIEILGEMKARKIFLPVIVCSAYELEEVPEVQDYPCLRYMIKPVKTDEMMGEIDELLLKTTEK